MKPTLLIMAAGMGSRYGSLKQLDGVGPSNETILDYSIFDAIKTGFGKVVFVIRKFFEKEFCEKIINKIEKQGIECQYVFQELENIPKNFKLPANREKPLGTAHAILMAQNVINEPFAAINSDDFYGRNAFVTMCNFLKNCDNNSNDYAMVGYNIMSTLSKSGSVSRGVCKVDDNDFLISIKERRKISLLNNQLIDIEEDNKKFILSGNEIVSMNFWGFTPTFFNYIEKSLNNFLKYNINDIKSELYIPTVVFELIKQNNCKIKVLHCNSNWVGVTYKEDKPIVVNSIKELVDKGIYPNNLFQ